MRCRRALMKFGPAWRASRSSRSIVPPASRKTRSTSDSGMALPNRRSKGSANRARPATAWPGANLSSAILTRRVRSNSPRPWPSTEASSFFAKSCRTFPAFGRRSAKVHPMPSELRSRPRSWGAGRTGLLSLSRPNLRPQRIQRTILPFTRRIAKARAAHSEPTSVAPIRAMRFWTARQPR